MKQFNLVLIFVLLYSGVFADDGMWMPHQMKDLNLNEKGLNMDPADLYKKDGSGLMSAVVHLGGGTGEFVSAKGLILTNHHVAFGAIQRASDKEHDYISDGFLAMNGAQEIPAAGYVADVLIGYEDVTDQVVRTLRKNQKPYDRYRQIEAITKELVRKAESGAADLRCSVRSVYSGNQYYLYTFKRLRDVRLVYAPPSSIGNFGGDVDNWMWPRHTGDFTFLRAYVSKDNVGSEYNKDNVPYQPKSFFTVSSEGVKDGDFSFIMGYPGRTYRNYTSAQFDASLEDLEKRLDQYRETIQFFEQAGENDRAIQIKYAGLIKGLNNGLKNSSGKLEGFSKRHISELKKKEEEAFVSGIKHDGERRRAENSLKQIEAFIVRNKRFGDRYELLNSLKSSFTGSALMGQAYTVYKASVEQQKPDEKREQGYQERDLPNLKQRVRLAERSYDFNTDRAYLKHVLKKYHDKRGLEIPKTLDIVFKKGETGIDEFVDKAYDTTVLNEADTRVALLEKSPEALLKTGDMLLTLASEIELLNETYDTSSKAMTQELSDLRKEFLGIALKYRKDMAPDANSTIRFTSGIIDGYSPRDAVYYKSKTSLAGVMEKEQQEAPFIVPARLKALHAQRDFGKYTDPELRDIATCFLNTTNVTGGNSGSPTLNARGELTGIIFDMSYESVTGDYYIIPELQRTISVDIRYVLFVTEKFSNAGYLLEEMTIK